MRPLLLLLTRRPAIAALALAGALVAAATLSRDATCAVGLLCTPPTPARARLVADGAPETLAETGLYADAALPGLAPDVEPYTPQYPLWSDGAAKRRWIRLPAGGVIDARDPDAWQLPVGTQLWKEFAFEGRRVETRYLERAADGWIFATYAWSQDGREAVLVPESGRRGAFHGQDGLVHDIPSRQDCAACHEGRAVPVLGFSALQLAPHRDPLAPHAETPAPGALTVEALNARGLLVPPSGTVEIAARSPRERAVLGYLHANCGSCHSARPQASSGALRELGLVLEWTSASTGPRPAAVSTTVDVLARFRPHGAETALPRIAAGDPSRSVLLLRAASRFAARQMPPLGTRRCDDDAVALLTAWIREDLAAPGATHPSED